MSARLVTARSRFGACSRAVTATCRFTHSTRSKGSRSRANASSQTPTLSCPKDLPSLPTERLAAMESRLQVMLAAVQTVRPALERFYQSLSDEQKARFNAIAPTDDP